MSPKISAFSDAKNELKDQIISTLSREENITAKGIHYTICKEFSSAVTYQGVHKALKQLTFQGIIAEKNHKYALNPKWIEELNSFVSKIDAKRTGKAKLDFGEIKNATSITLPFDSYLDALYAILDNMDRDMTEKPSSDLSVAHWYHAWPITCISKKEFEQIRRVLGVGKHYALINQETALDVTLANFWKDVGKKVRMGVPCATNCDLVVTQDKIVQIFLSPPVRKGIDLVFQDSNRGKTDFANLYSFIYGLKGNVSLIITCNAELADQIREETLKYFK